jgi:hypothetical protein
MNRYLLILFIGLWTTDAFVPHRKVNVAVASTPVKMTSNPQPHESHGITKSAATIALAGLMWVGIASGIPVVHPAAAAAAPTSSELTEIVKKLDGLATKEDLKATKEDLKALKEAMKEDLQTEFGKLDVKIDKIGNQLIMYGYVQILVVAATSIAPIYATTSVAKIKEKVTSFEETLLEVDATIVESAIAAEEKNAAMARSYALVGVLTVCIVALVAH